MGRLKRTTILNLQERVMEKRMMVAKMRMLMKKRQAVRVLNLLMLEPCWRKMTTWNTSYPSTIAAPATSSIKCPQSMRSTHCTSVSRSTFAKCSSLWNKSSRSTTAAEVIEDHCKLQLVRPIVTRCNLLFSAVERIVRITRARRKSPCSCLQ